MELESGLLKQEEFSSSSFDPEKFVREIASDSIGDSDILTTKLKLINFADDTARRMKQSVSKNYSKFISTAEEVTLLEEEMYQLRSLLSQNKALLTALKDFMLKDEIRESPSLSSNATKGALPVNDDFNLNQLLEQAESIGLISKYPKQRKIIYKSELNQLNSETLLVTERLFACLMNSCIVLCQPLKSKSTRYNLVTAFDIDRGLTVVDVKDSNDVRNVFRIVKRGEHFLFQADNVQIKSFWIDAIVSLLSVLSKDVGDKISEEILDEMDDSSFQQLMGDLSLLIAHRELEDAASLILRCREKITKKKGPAALDYKAKLGNLENSLINRIKSECQSIQERGLSGGLRSPQKNIQILLKLDYTSDAIDLFIQYQKMNMRYALKNEFKISDSGMYINAFFTTLKNSYLSFLSAFGAESLCNSTFITWVMSEIKLLISKLFVPVYSQSRLEMNRVVPKAEIILQKAALLSESFDVLFMFENELAEVLNKTLSDEKNRLLELIRVKSKEEKWRPRNYLSVKSLNAEIEEFEKLGLAEIKVYVIDKFYINLSALTILFAKVYLKFIYDCLRIHFQDICHCIVESVVEIMKLYLKYTTNAFNQDTISHHFIFSNVDFAINVVFKRAEKAYVEKVGSTSKYFLKIYEKYDKYKNLFESKMKTS